MSTRMEDLLARMRELQDELMVAKKANAKQQVRDNLRYLHTDHGLLEQDSNPAGGTGCVWRRKQRPSYETEN